MIVKFNTDELVECICGFKPDHYSVAYGRTPYDVFCPTCKKQTSFAKCKVSGGAGNVIDYWNKHISQMTTEQVREEIVKFDLRRNREPYNEYRVYEYYWVEDKGAVLNKQY